MPSTILAPPRTQLRNRSCRNKQQLHDQVNHFSFFFFERGPFHAFLSRLRVVLPTQTSADKAQTIVILTSPVKPPRGAAAEQQHPVWRWLFASLSVSDFVGLNIHSATTIAHAISLASLTVSSSSGGGGSGVRFFTADVNSATTFLRHIINGVHHAPYTEQPIYREKRHVCTHQVY